MQRKIYKKYCCKCRYTIEYVITSDITRVSHEKIHLVSNNILPIANSLV